MNNERNYGIDFLRLVLMYMVCILHTLGQGEVLDSCPVDSGKYKAFWLLEILCFSAVDGFAIISGFFASDKPRKYEKLAEMWFQVFFYSFILTMLFTIAGVNSDWPKTDIIKCALPVTYEKFWYFTAFFALFFVIPILNKFVFALNEQKSKIAFLVLILFSCMTLMADAFKVKNGYSTIWIMILYCIGALAKRGRIFEGKSTRVLIVIWGICVLLTWWTKVFKGTNLLVNYVSPTILLSGLLMVIIFSRISLKGTIISRVSPLAFGIYLFQLNQVIWGSLKNRVSFVGQFKFGKAVVYVVFFAMMIFVTGIFVEFVRNKLAKVCRISELSKKIVTMIKWILQKSTVILK